MEETALQQQGVSVRVAAMRLGENPALAGLKRCNRLEQILARSEPEAASSAETLMRIQSRRLVSGTMTDVFLVGGSPRAGSAARECVLWPADREAPSDG